MFVIKKLPLDKSHFITEVLNNEIEGKKRYVKYYL